MVVVSECFPSDHELVYTACESYRAHRASLAQQPHSSSQSGADGTDASSNSATGSGQLETILAAGSTVPPEIYPGGFREFLKNSKLHLNDSQSIDETIRSVQKMVLRINSRSLDTINQHDHDGDLPADNYNSSTQPKHDKTSGHDDLMIDSDVAEPTTIDEILLRAKVPKRKSLIDRAKQMEALTVESYIRKHVHKLHQRPSQVEHQSSKTNISPSAPAAPESARRTTNYPLTVTRIHPKSNKTGKYNGCAPRYLDVFKKESEKPTMTTNIGAVEPQFPTEETAAAADKPTDIVHPGRYAFFEQKWTELPVSVVNIHL